MQKTSKNKSTPKLAIHPRLQKSRYSRIFKVNAIWHITDKIFLLDIIESDDNGFVRKSAKERLKKLIDEV